MIQRNYRLAVPMLGLLLFGQYALGDNEQAIPVSFRSQIAPIMLDNCLACHGPKKAEGGYRVDTYAELVKAGDSGELPIATSAGQPSELLRRIACVDESERMPAESEPLSDEQIELVRQWIAEGAVFDGQDASLPLALVIPPPNYAAPPERYAHAIPIAATTFSPDGKQIITGGYHELLVWSTQDTRLVRRIQNIGQRVFALAFSPDGVTLAVGCGDPGRSGEVRLIDFATGEVQAVVARTSDVVLDLAYRPGAEVLAVASADSTIRLIDTRALQVVKTIASHADWVTAVAWSEDGSRLVSASRDKSAKVYDGTTGELIASYQGHGAAVRGVAVLADNQQVVSAGADNKLHRWNIDDAKKVAELATEGEGYKLILSGTQLYLPCSNRRLLRIDLESNTISQVYEGHHDWVMAACYWPGQHGPAGDGLVASGAFDGEMRLWNTADTSLLHQWNARP